MDRFPRGVVDSSSLEIVKIPLDIVLDNWL